MDVMHRNQSQSLKGFVKVSHLQPSALLAAQRAEEERAEEQKEKAQGRPREVPLSEDTSLYRSILIKEIRWRKASL